MAAIASPWTGAIIRVPEVVVVDPLAPAPMAHRPSYVLAVTVPPAMVTLAPLPSAPPPIAAASLTLSEP